MYVLHTPRPAISPSGGNSLGRPHSSLGLLVRQVAKLDIVEIGLKIMVVRVTKKRKLSTVKSGTQN